MAESESLGNWQTSSFSSLMAALFVSFRFRSSVHVESVDSRALYLIGRSILPLFLNQSNRRSQSGANFLLLLLPVYFFYPVILSSLLSWNENKFSLVGMKISPGTSGK